MKEREQWVETCVRQEDGEGGTGEASDILKAQSSGEDPRATGGLVSNLPHPRVNKTKQHTSATVSQRRRRLSRRVHAGTTASCGCTLISFWRGAALKCALSAVATVGCGLLMTPDFQGDLKRQCSGLTSSAGRG